MNCEPLVVIGIGDDGPAGLSAKAQAHLAAAEVLAGGKRHLGFFPDFPGERIVFDADFAKRITRIKECYPRHKTVVLASGDPLFYGIAKTLLETIPKDDLRFMPQVSSVQLAFARLKESWHDACVVSLHGRPMEQLLPALQRCEAKIAILTDAQNNPAAIARCLIEQGQGDDYTLWVCENLGGPKERITSGSAQEIANATFGALNVVVLLRTISSRSGMPSRTRGTPGLLLGIPEASFQHRGLITKREVRLLSLCYLELRAGEVLWDVGAGSGSVAIEAARLASDLQVFAVEKSAEAFGHIEENVRQFGVDRVRPVLGEAPDALAGLPDPDAVFIGGSGGKLSKIVRVASQRLRSGGRIVINCITLENFTRGWEELRALNLDPSATSIQLAHSRPLGSLHCLEPDHTIFILRARKP